MSSEVKQLTSEDIKVIIRDLSHFKESDEYKKICKSLENAIEADRWAIISAHEGWEVNHDVKYSFHCLKWQENIVFTEFLDNIKTKWDGIDRMKSYISEKIEANRISLVGRLSSYGSPYSLVTYTELDKKRFLTISRQALLSIVDDTIASVKPEAPDTESKDNEDIYEN